MSRRVSAVLAAALASVLSPAVHAGVNDPFPGDTVPPPPDLWSVAGYAFERQQEGPYRRGAARSATQLHTWIGALRVARSFQVAGFTVAPALAFTYATGRADRSLPPTGQTSARGFGDLRFGAQAWLVNEPSLRRYVSLTGLVLAPTGRYEEREPLSIGENRWRYLVQAAWHEGLGKRWNLEIVSEAVWSGLNGRYLARYTLDQDPGYSLTGFLRYRVDDALQLALGGQVNTGGQTRLDGSAQDNHARSTRLYAGASYAFTPALRAHLRAGHDVTFANGFRTRRELALRITRFF